MPDDDEKAALVKRPSEALPPIKIASSIYRAGPGSLIYLDRKGRLTTPPSGGVLAGVLLAFTAYNVYFSGLVGLGVSAAFWLYFGRVLHRNRRFERASQLIVHDRLDEAEALLRQLLQPRFMRKRERAHAEQSLDLIAVLRGDYVQALARQRAATTLFGRSAVRTRLVAYAEVLTLVNLDRIGEARQRMEQERAAHQGRDPASDLLRWQFWAAELYVCFAEGSHAIDAESLYERARLALLVNGASLLGLSAWAHVQLGDHDQAWHLLREAFERRDGLHLDRRMPRLHAWMESHAAEAGVEARLLLDRPADAAEDG